MMGREDINIINQLILTTYTRLFINPCDKKQASFKDLLELKINIAKRIFGLKNMGSRVLQVRALKNIGDSVQKFII